MLTVGMKIKLPQSGVAEVIMVSESRARVKLLSERACNFSTATGKEVQFNAGGREIDISPNAEVQILGLSTIIGGSIQ
jgi:hypothetical protein